MAFAAILAAVLLAPTQPGAEPANLPKLRAEADAVIRAASAQAHFANDTRWDMPAVRHKASGMRCLFQVGDAANRIVHIGGINGGGMGCHSRPAGFRQTLDAVRLGPGETLDGVFAASVLNLTFQRTDAKPYEGARMVVRVEPSSGVPPPAEPRSARYVIGAEGEAVFSLVSVAIVDGWIIRQTFEAPLARAEEADMLAGVVMSTTLIDLASRGGG